MNSTASPAPRPTKPARWPNLIWRAWPYALFSALLLYGWRTWGLATSLPAYDDVLEVLWAMRWYAGALAGRHGLWLYPLAFYPSGWHVATYAQGPAVIFGLLLLNLVGGAAFAFNALTLFTYLLAFAGMYRLARGFVGSLPAALAALLFTFWGFRWFRIAGHPNVLLASALLPWMAWSLERWLDSQCKKQIWLAVVGFLWAFAILSSSYFLWIGGLLLILWVAGRLLGRQMKWRQALIGMALPCLVALALSAPWLAWFQRESTAGAVAAYEASHVSMWDASLNALPVPNVFHPWLGSMARWVYRGPVNEPGQANLGLIACLLALFALKPALKDRRWWPALLWGGIGLVLALGMTLKWNGEALQWNGLRPLDSMIWRIAHALKPQVFVPAQPPAPFATAVPLPGMLLSAAIPFWERARVFARYALLGSLGVYLLTALGLARVRKTWAQIALAALLVIEILPPPSGAVPFPPSSHPAFQWLAAQRISPSGIIDLGSWQQNLLYIPFGGNSLWATDYHQQPTVAGAATGWPIPSTLLDKWLQSHPHAFLDSEFVPLLRFYNIALAVFHVSGGYAEEMLEEAKLNPDLHNLRCFDPSDGSGPWPYPICIFEVGAATPGFNLLFREGWSGAEEWGRWAEGTESRAAWVATSPSSQTLALTVFPFCVPDRSQAIEVAVNGAKLASHQWHGCEDWSTEIKIPASVVRTGWNEVVLRRSYGLRPIDVTDGQNKDPRALSVGVARFEVKADASG